MRSSIHACLLTLALTSVACDPHVDVMATKPGQATVDDSQEHCSISTDAALLFDYNIVANGPKGTAYKQARLMLEPGRPALCTVTEIRDEADPEIVRVNSAGFIARFKTLKLPFVDVPISEEVLTHRCGAVIPSNENSFVECLVDDGQNTNIVVTAPHGGAIEPRTDDQARAAYNLLQGGVGVSSWICEGRHNHGAHEHWHISSNDIGVRSFPELSTIADRNFAHAIAFHGMKSAFVGEMKVLVGGRASVQKREAIVSALHEALTDPDAEGYPQVDVVLAMPGDENAGTEEDNFVNWLTATGDDGIQIEQSLAVRQQHWELIATTVAATVASF